MSNYYNKRGYQQVVEFVPKSSNKGEEQADTNKQGESSNRKQLSTNSQEFKFDQNSKSQQPQNGSKKGGKNGKPKGNQGKNDYIQDDQNSEYSQQQSQKYNNGKKKPNNKPKKDPNQQQGQQKNKQYEGNQYQEEQNGERSLSKKEKYNKNNNRKPKIQKGSSDSQKNDREEKKVDENINENIGQDMADSDEEVKEIEDFSHVPKSELAEILADRFSRSKIECPICFNRIKKDAKLWSCRQCYGPFHLGCIHRWITKNPVNENKGKDQKYFNWSCPKCNYAYTEQLPEYKCFCSKVSNPEYDPYGLPHSCGDKCMKIQTKGCVHPCTQVCHPGPCPPCNKFGKELTCYCGKKKVVVKCSNPNSGFSCQEICGKTLSCGKHQCQQVCHEGPCAECEVLVERDCFCGEKEEKRPCGKENFSCGGKCNKKKDCGNHHCEAICHDGACEECPYTPEKMQTCCCGRMSTMSLGLDNRKSCLDPIPVCGLPCGKVLPCGHKCKKSCHPGPCSKCTELVTQKCRCQRNERKIECWKTTEGDETEKQFLCERICRKYLSCKKHKCQRLCCDVTKGNDPDGHHLCIKVCEKPLSCGNHTCNDFCHIGDCKPCPIIINHPLSCICGKTVRNPPLQCGAKNPECDYPCSRVRDCGHPCRSKCHYDECLPCDEPVEKECKCGKKIIKNAKCSFPASCGQPCQTPLACGHVCGIVCHAGECDLERGKKGCGQKCGKKRSCGHKCESSCHPNEENCPNVGCKVMITITCPCGNRETMIRCGDKEEKKLECDRQCATMKRFGGFFQKTTTKKSYFPPTLVRFAKSHLSYLLGIEDRLEKMFKEGREMIDIPLYDRNMGKKSALQTLISRHYNMDLEYYLHVKNPTIVVKLNQDSKLPPMNLSEYLRQIELGKITPEILPFEATVKFINLSQNDRTEELELIWKNYKGEYYLERNEQKQLMAHFWRKEIAEEALLIVKKSFSNFAQAVLEENTALKDEEEKIESIQKDVKVSSNQDSKSMEGSKKKSDFVFLALNQDGN